MLTPEPDLFPEAFTRADHDALIAHYKRVAPLLLANLGPIPIVTGFVPDWNSGRAVFEGLIEKALPTSIATVEVRTTRRVGRYIVLAENALLWQAHRGAIEFLSWTSTPADPDASRSRASCSRHRAPRRRPWSRKPRLN